MDVSENTPRKGRFFLLHKALVAVAAALYLLGIVAPNHYLPWVSFYNEAPVFAALIAISMTPMVSRNTVQAPRGIWWILTCSAALVCFQWAIGILHFSGQALMGVLYLAGTALAWRIGGVSIRVISMRNRAISFFSAVIASAALICAGIALMQWLRLAAAVDLYVVEIAPGMRPAGNVAQPNLLATLLLMGTVATALLWRQQLIRTWQAAMILLSLSFALVITESRAGLLSAACVGLVVLFRAKACGWVGGRRVVLVWWLLLAILRLLWAPLNEWLLLQNAREIQVGVDGVRQILWRQIAAAIFIRPWSGYGWNQTQIAQKAGVAAAPGEWPTDYAHNIGLDVVAWFGIPVGMLVIGLAVWWISHALWRVRCVHQLFLFGIVTPVIVHSMLEFPFAYAFLLFPVAFALGALHALQAPASWPIRPAECSVGRRLIAAGLLAIYALAAGRVAFEYLETEEDMRVMRFELRHVGQRPSDHGAPHLLLLNQLDDMLKLGRLQPGRGMAPDVLNRMGRANAFLNWATLHLNYVVALGLNGQPEEASRQLRVLRDLYGPKTYFQAKAELLSLRDRSYPELAAVELP